MPMRKESEFYSIPYALLISSLIWINSSSAAGTGFDDGNSADGSNYWKRLLMGIRDKSALTSLADTTDTTDAPPINFIPHSPINSIQSIPQINSIHEGTAEPDSSLYFPAERDKGSQFFQGLKEFLELEEVDDENGSESRIESPDGFKQQSKKIKCSDAKGKGILIDPDSNSDEISNETDEISLEDYIALINEFNNTGEGSKESQNTFSTNVEIDSEKANELKAEEKLSSENSKPKKRGKNRNLTREKYLWKQESKKPIWNFFHYDESKPNWALCKACSTGFTQYQNGNLLEHLNQRHKEQLEHLPVVERFARPNERELQSPFWKFVTIDKDNPEFVRCLECEKSSKQKWRKKYKMFKHLRKKHEHFKESLDKSTMKKIKSTLKKEEKEQKNAIKNIPAFYRLFFRPYKRMKKLRNDKPVINEYVKCDTCRKIVQENSTEMYLHLSRYHPTNAFQGLKLEAQKPIWKFFDIDTMNRNVGICKICFHRIQFNGKFDMLEKHTGVHINNDKSRRTSGETEIKGQKDKM